MIVAQFTAIVGAAVVIYLGYLYMAFRSAEERAPRRVYRQRFTRAMLASVFGAYVIGVLFPNTGGWPAEIGQSIGRVVRSSQPSLLPASEVSGIDILVRWLKVLGLIVYTVAWLIVSFSAQLPVKLYRAIFG